MSAAHTYPRLRRKGVAPKPGIVHLGPGAFFRAFNAIYTEEAMRILPGDWGITAVSLKSTTTRDQLSPQDYAYTAVELSPTGRTSCVISSINKILVAAENPHAVLCAMVDPAVKIVSLTITEKGYCHNPATGRLNKEHPEILADLSNIAQPTTAPGYIVAALSERRARGVGPFSVLSCDNLPANGKIARAVVLELAHQLDSDLAQWIDREVTFPCTMVDRITPAVTDRDVEALALSTGYYDPGCVVHEPFRQWVVENNFVAGHPDWDRVGVQFVNSVDSHELMKLRCLNGTHSALAYLGYLAGYKTIAETVTDPLFARFCEYLWANEITPTLPQPEGEDLVKYCRTLLQRYRNPSIHHKTWQIAMDGSQKLPQRILSTISDNLAAGREPKGLCLVVAGWMRYVSGQDEQGKPIDVRDPLAKTLLSMTQSTDDPVERVSAILSIREIFDAELVDDKRFCDTVTKAYVGLLERDTIPMIKGLLT